ncbi:MAG: endonuclease I, partial [Paraglaciecola sp.]|nr:endonuclease I [Paraglaciecola sp.]
MKLKYPALLALFMVPVTQASDLVITGVFDGPLTGGVPKGIELFVNNDIANLSQCGVGSANNGEGSDGQEFTFPAVSVSAGTYIYVASESPQFEAFFGFAPTYTSGAMAINGDDAVELFCNAVVVDVFGEINVDGSGQPWDHVDGWAYRSAGTGPDGATFVLGNWTFSGTNNLEGGTTNDTTRVPFPLKSFADETGGGDTGGGDTGGGDTGGGDTG